ncbi:MAG: pyridoxamine 5'-phosphate oxidase family protein [Desulfitobacteriaceae bacterium]|nr:pyridoxamine 5'-phosphate oxidase family protein [Desulfitobacteriaceae bacterium]MDD4751910.1 pyridoxamine 5'-phosphate oxidase family protein [Desulfitobacteriaceae bacterium]
MAKLNEDVKKVISQTKTFPVATASKEGVPNVIPFAFVKCYGDDALLLADNFMQKSIANLEENPQMAICVWDSENKQAYQIKGEVTILKSGNVFDETIKWVQGVLSQLTPKTALLMKVTHVYVCQPGPDIGREL